jgi:chromosome partitioning protein
MLVISVLQSKGGVGKSTLCFNLAVTARTKYPRVAILDTDPQLSTDLWRRLRAEHNTAIPNDITVFGNENSPQNGIEKLALDGWDVVFIDTPGHAMANLREAARISSLALVVMKCSVLDLHSSKDAISICHQENANYAVLLNLTEPGTVTHDEIRQLLVNEDVPVLTAEVQRRHLYVTSVATGQAGHEMPGAHAAKKEMTRLWDEIEAKAKLQTHAKPQVAAHV